MDSEQSLATPAASKSVKVTYSSKQKRVRGGVDNTEDNANEQNGIQEENGRVNGSGEHAVSESETSAVKTSKNAMTAPADVDTNLQPTDDMASAPSQSTDTLNGQAEPITPLPKPRSRVKTSAGAASTRSVPKRPGKENGVAPSSTADKSRSSTESRSTPKRSRSQVDHDTDAEEDGSVSDATTTSAVNFKRTRTSEAQRLKMYEDDPNCQEIEPHRAHCAVCNKWISLGQRQSYALAPWMTHIKRCINKADGKSPSKPDEANGEEDEEEEEKADEGDSPSVIAESVTSDKASASPVRRSEADRIAYLEADPQAGEITPHEVFCTACNKKIKLAPKQRYGLSNWHAHRTRCPRSSGQVATTQRKLQLELDPLAKNFDVHHVECALCGTSVTLDGQGGYALAMWESHKAHCPKASREGGTPLPKHRSRPSVDNAMQIDSERDVQASASGSGSGSGAAPLAEEPTFIVDEQPSRFERAEVENLLNAADTTMAVDSTSAPSPAKSVAQGEEYRPRSRSQKGKKRARDYDSSEDEEEDERPKRARTERYVAPEQRPDESLLSHIWNSLTAGFRHQVRIGEESLGPPLGGRTILQWLEEA